MARRHRLRGHEFVAGPPRRTVLLLAALTAACGVVPRGAANDTVLAARIWDPRADAFVPADELRRKVVAAEVVLLGETHDNAFHHRLQRDLLAEIVAGGRRPALVMEQFDREHQAAIDAETARPGRTADTVLDAGHFDRRGWQVDGYRPLVALALEFGLPIVAANVSREEARLIVRDPARAAALPPVDKAVETALAEDIRNNHCGETIPPTLLTGMIAAQRARDLAMAETIERHRARGAVLIAGIGHVRAERGAPLYMKRRPLIVAFLEVEPERRQPSEYFDGAFATRASFDYAWFTPRAARQDPCAPPAGRPAATTG